MKGLQGKATIVTGGSSSIGQAIAIRHFLDADPTRGGKLRLVAVPLRA
jgi:NAD(P)-dependent dehydrogenase (short-subunit alcohol dehydrogenase family)